MSSPSGWSLEAGSHGRALAWMRSAWGRYAIGGGILVALYYVVPAGPASVAVYAAVGVYAVAGMVAGAVRLDGRNRLAWLAFAIGIALMSAGDGYWNVGGLGNQTVPVPSPADWIYLGAYPFLLLGLALLISGGSLRRTTFLDAGIVALAIGAAVWMPLFETYRESDGLGRLAQSITLAYPVVDLLLLAVLAVFVVTGAARIAAYWLLAGAVAFLLVADLVFYGLAGQDTPGSWMDSGWLLAYVLWGTAALHSSASALGRPSREDDSFSRSRFVLLAVPLALGAGAVLVEAASSGSLSLTDVLIGSALVALVLVRMSGILRSLEVARAELATRNALLAESEQRFRSVFDDAPEGIAMLGIDGSIMRANTALSEFSGYTRAELERMSFADLVPAPHREAWGRILHRRLGWERSLAHERQFVSKAGDEVWALASLSVVRDAGHRPVYLIALLQDITRRRDAEAQLEERNRELLEADRLKDEVMSVVAHDLRTPLTSVIGYVDLVLDDSGTDSLSGEQRQFLETARRSAGRLISLVNDLLFISQARAGKLALSLGEVDVTALLADELETLRPQAREQAIVLQLEQPEEPVAIVADAARIAQVVENLATNAMKFTPPGGTVTLGASWSEDEVLLTVADTGCGIEAADQQHLFDRFFRTRSAAAVPGVGLGLSIVRAVVEAHGGRVSLHSTPGVGTTFSVLLPSSPPAAALSDAA